VVLEPDEIRVVGQRLAGHRRLSHLRHLDQDRGRLGRADPGAGEDQRRREVPLAEPPADVALDLASLVGQRSVAIVGPLGGVALRGVRVPVEQ
jgi:hypothetical protein